MPKVIFVNADGSDSHEFDAKTGETLLEVARRHDVDIEGACEGSMACSTCHVVVDPDYFERLKPAGDEELDMLDLAFDLQPTSRLGCQIEMTDDLDGLTVRLPATTRNVLLG
jgi:2Fe-2S ferredoxin